MYLKVERKSLLMENDSLLPSEHPEYSLGFAFSHILKILHVPEVGLDLFKIHALYSGKGILWNCRWRVCHSLFHHGGTDFSGVL